MRGVAVAGGESPSPEILKKIAEGADLLVAADSGLLACEAAGLVPDRIVGDMDSLNDLRRLEKYPPGHVRRFSAAKNFSDTELALALLRENGCDEIWIAGGGGGRMDHLIAIASLFESENPPDRWFPGKEEIHCLKDGGVLRGQLPEGSIVSVFPLVADSEETGTKEPVSSATWETESSGLRWPLNDLDWRKGGLGLSNETVTETFEIRSVRGRFMVVMPVSV